MTFTQNRLIQPFIELDFGSCEIPEQLCPSYMKIYDDMNFSISQENHTYIKIIPSSYTVFIILYNKKGSYNLSIIDRCRNITEIPADTVEDISGCFISVMDDNAFYIPSYNDSQPDDFVQKLLTTGNYDKRVEHFNSFLRNSFQITHCPVEIENMRSMIIHSKGDISVSMLAEQTGFSCRHINRIFTSYYGFGPKDYCRYVRFQYALDEIFKNPFRQNSEFIQNSSYSDQAHFQREFKQFTGITPKQFINSFTA